MAAKWTRDQVELIAAILAAGDISRRPPDEGPDGDAVEVYARICEELHWQVDKETAGEPWWMSREAKQSE